MRRLLLFVSLCVAVFGQAQQNQLWKGYFSYNEVRDITRTPNRALAASENALFSQNVASGELRTVNTIDGLPSEQISAVYHSASVNRTFIGYRNGLIVVINETDGSLLRVVDIINKQLSPLIKKVNHFMEHEGFLYISGDFGISKYDLSTFEFGDTFYIGTSVAEIAVSQTAVFDGYLYAATSAEGLKRGAIDNPDLIDADQWQPVATGNFTAVEAFGTSLFTASADGSVRRSANGTAFSAFGPILSPPASDLRATEDELLVVNPGHVYIYDDGLVQQAHITTAQITEEAVVFSCATLVGNTLFVGTQEDGLLSFDFPATAAYEFIRPDGPERNNVFSLTVLPSGNFWTVFGEYNQFLSPRFRSYGLSKFSVETGWLTIPYSEVDASVDLVRVTANPANESEIFVSSYNNGLLRFENDVLADHYDHTNSGLEAIANTASVRVEQSAFDSQGNLWMTNAIVTDGLKMLRPNGQWLSVSTEDILEALGTSRFGRMLIDRNGTKWLCTLEDGLVGYNENRAIPFRKITDGPDLGNLPAPSVQAIAIDNRNQMWIGTRKGLRVLSSVDRFMNEEDTQLTTNAIIFEEENGQASELMYEQFITDIVVDGANNKWIGTATAGVFLVSSDGQRTIHHFTSSNSPLPNNNVNDIDINQATGEVFFATVSGMVSFKGSAIAASDNLREVKVYPNPVRPGYAGTVKVSGLTEKANVKITDISGSLVHEVISDGGTIEWDTTAFGKYRVASGVYMVFIATQDGAETTVKKVMIVR